MSRTPLVFCRFHITMALAFHINYQKFFNPCATLSKFYFIKNFLRKFSKIPFFRHEGLTLRLVSSCVMIECLIRVDLIPRSSWSNVVKGVPLIPKLLCRKFHLFDLRWPHDYVITLKLRWWPFQTMTHRSRIKSRKMFGDGGTLKGCSY